jgi:hypothetical protein
MQMNSDFKDLISLFEQDQVKYLYVRELEPREASRLRS